MTLVPDRDRLVVQALPEGVRQRRACEGALAMELHLPLHEARQLLSRLPARLPRALGVLATATLERALSKHGASVAREPAPHGEPCPFHSTFTGEVRCKSCERPLCTLCAALGACRDCARKAGRKRSFFLVRVTILLSVLALVLLYAAKDVWSRRARTDWSRALDVAIVLVELEPLDDGVPALLERAGAALEARLGAEASRHGLGALPFHVEVFGPVRSRVAPPEPPADDGLVEAARFSLALRSFSSDANEAAGIARRRFDSTVYVLARPPASRERAMVEGLGQQGGRLGLVRVELSAKMVEFALFVAAHELFHTLGATDKYDAAGHPAYPEGFPDPGRSPLHPQAGAELMARHKSVGEGKSVPPKDLSELFVGAATAREIGWTK